MKCVVGLGNPGSQYAGTRHNAGFMVLHRLSGGVSFRSAFRGELAETQVDGGKILLFKPLTYMNLSGGAVTALVAYYKITPADVLVICDDMDLPLGRLRLRARGSAGGHNGLKSIIASLGADDFWRLRIGVGRPLLHDPARYVLMRFGSEEKEAAESVLTRAAEAAALWCRGRSAEAMNIYNRVEDS
ncbi:MAG: aminoacyl-tRNA hydrolase [Gracilibacteraceae bacterium]|jgi:PTH1 family peptidyl-tRNA hydrolase|nr:aminoacyl-tRNA hydrolase [Gracilibacteraceae bacterium]